MALGLTLPAVNLNAQDGPRPRPGDGARPPLPPLVVALDINHDGAIDQTELAGAPEALRALDKNGDGQLTPAELRPGRGPRPEGAAGPGEHPRPPRDEAAKQAEQGGPAGGRRPGPPLVMALDANHDGVIDASEISNATTALMTLDKNSDGKLTIEELQPHGPRRGEGPGRPGNKRRPRPAEPQE
jgi:hypothetical protein